MARARFLINRGAQEAGFSLIEALLAVTVFGFLVAALAGAFIYGRAGTAGAGDRARAAFVADEGVEAVRNIKDAGYSNLTDGTYGVVQSGGVWTLSGSSSATDIFNRSVTIASNGSNRKTITSSVTWSGAAGSGQVDVVSELSNWLANLPKTWANPSQYAGLDLTGSLAGYKVATQGSYAYLVRNSTTGPNFFVINLSTPTSPTVVGSLTLGGAPTNIAVSGNYAYVSSTSDTQELQIVSIATPASPSLTGSYNAAGTGDGKGVFVVGTTVYLVRAANGGNDEFVIINAATPSAPTRIGGYSLNVTMYEVYVSGTTAYIATSSDTQELLVLNMVVPSLLTLGTAVNLPGTNDATTISGYGSTLVVGQGTTLYTLSTATLLVPTVTGSITLPGTINEVAADSTHNYAFVGTSYTSGQFQVVNIANPASPAVLSSVALSTSANLTGIAYNATLDVAVGATSNNSQELAVFGPN